ncbi:MAG: DUF167 domain-containing protein [Alphaproteobacteria bacterium]|nr:DUF167 domain-containing protein [Alphaproteobacteria bacterium]
MRDMYVESEKGLLLSLKVVPNAGSTQIKDVVKDADGKEFLRVLVSCVPEKGKANKEVIKLLSKELKLPKSAFSIAVGETSHYKKILIDTQSSDVITKLNEWRANGCANN